MTWDQFVAAYKDSATLIIAGVSFVVSACSAGLSWNTHKINKARFEREKEDRDEKRLPRLEFSSHIQDDGDARLYCDFENRDYGRVLIREASVVGSRHLLLAKTDMEHLQGVAVFMPVNPIGQNVVLSEWLDADQPLRIVLMVIPIKGEKIEPGTKLQIKFRMAFAHRDDKDVEIKRVIVF
ncbi:hypothetical protein JQ594_05295 [Bradyrhizobium manausense]|uniref:hypothetical protein n=1 Tax=Bradyrhizobium manausense TaxID=989370 RepID=UPI001BA60855|nr:hypothetical protein [Bradyrhizobium manausense]MBR0685320.1 hypothetical protein [Bradyrhizobium manausense]